MTKEEHIKKHKELHKALDELVADYLAQAKGGNTASSIYELMVWSYYQTSNPTGEHFD
ncbi:hypothetical protein KAR91_52035 [Candidatus Pacearchaeota archaeon]|nr:hypothetical protein [Candidatus Pacearchaeota archaeon]